MTTQEFLEKYLPNYHSDDRVVVLDDYHKYLTNNIEDGKNSIADVNGIIEMKRVVNTFNFYSSLQDDLFSEALENYNKINKV